MAASEFSGAFQWTIGSRFRIPLILTDGSSGPLPFRKELTLARGPTV